MKGLESNSIGKRSMRYVAADSEGVSIVDEVE